MPTALLLEPFGIPDQGILDQIERLRNQPLSSPEGPVLPYPQIPADVSLDEANSMLAANQEAVNSYWESVGGQMSSISDQIADLEALYRDQMRWWPKGSLRVQMYGFPAGTFLIRINDVVLKANFQRIDETTGTMKVTVPPQIPNPAPEWKQGVAADGSLGAEKQGFAFFNAGSSITIVSEFPIAHVVSCIPGQVLGVYAYRNYGGFKKLTAVPPDNYVITQGYTPATVSPIAATGPGSRLINAYNQRINMSLTQNTSAPQIQASGWFQPLYVTMKRPLSISTYMRERNEARIEEIVESMRDVSEPVPSRIEDSESWDDQIYVTVRSSVGPNVVNIISWIIHTFTEYTTDDASFDLVRTQMANHPSNFCLFERKDVMTILNEITTQCACAIWLKDGVFYIRYLLVEPEPTDTITIADIEHGTLQITSTDTEEIVTKLIASYRPNYSNETRDHKSILRYNIGRYGVQEQTMDYYAFNIRTLIKKFGSYWLIRKANTWKRITFKTFLHKLNIETLDCLTVDLGTLVANVPVKGIVESSIYNSNDSTIEMTVWLPVRLGEMVPFDFAWPVVTEYVDIPETLLQSGSGGGLIEYQPGELPDQLSGGSGGSTPSFQWEDDGRVIDSTFVPYTRPAAYPEDYEHRTFSDQTVDTWSSTPTPNVPYHLRDAIPIDLPSTSAEATGGGIPGKVLGGSGNEYEVEIYPEGLDGEPLTVNVLQLQIDSTGGDIAPDTWVIVTKVKGSYYMQVPVWLAEPSS
jgi:hypothetical protein